MRHPFLVILWLTRIWLFNKIVDLTPIFIITVVIIKTSLWFYGFFVKMIVIWIKSFKTSSFVFGLNLNDDKTNCSFFISTPSWLLFNPFLTSLLFYRFLDLTFWVSVEGISIIFLTVSSTMLFKYCHSSTPFSFAYSFSMFLPWTLSSLLKLLFPRSCKWEIDRFSYLNILLLNQMVKYQLFRFMIFTFLSSKNGLTAAFVRLGGIWYFSNWIIL